MANTVQCIFKRYEKKYFLTPSQRKYLLSRMQYRLLQGNKQGIVITMQLTFFHSAYII